MKPKSTEAPNAMKPKIIVQHSPIVPIAQSTAASEWEEFLAIEDEYNPAIPNEYEKIVQERREKTKRDQLNKRQRSNSPGYGKKHGSGFAYRRNSSDEEDSYSRHPNANRGSAIAPPKSVQENATIVDTSKIANINSYGASTVAAKIMAKYGDYQFVFSFKIINNISIIHF